jgi:hypothetical protein
MVRQSMMRRVHACNDSGGGHFQHLLRTDFVNNKKSTAVKLGMCIVDVVHHF